MRFARYALVTLVVAWSLSSVTETHDAELDAWNRLVEVVELIRNDPAAASLAAVDWWCADFLLLRHPQDDFTKEAAELETFLISFVRTSTDDWLVDRIASSMADCFKVAAIEFRIDPGDREAIVQLAQIFVNDDSVLSYFVWDAMEELEDRYEHDPELGEKLARSLGG